MKLYSIGLSLTKSDTSDYSGKPSAGEEGEAKEAKSQVRHRDKAWSGRDDSDTFIDHQLWAS